uniref:Redoxin domain-containing protein n=1 Tax=Eiseniibacteriota bacterium TaxID=2212470 RepID=A0A832I339_UNCEI
MIRNILAAALAAAALAIPAAAVAERPATALCVVCALKHGESAPEPVRAWRTHAGRDYGFCSAGCAEQFDADPAAFVPPDLPRPAPPFSLRGLDGGTVSLASFRGRVVLVDFWATWCAPCVRAMPELESLARELRAKGAEVLGISIDEGGAAKVRRFVEKRKVTYPIALDDARAPAWEAYRVKAIPAAFLVDREGRIVRQWLGRTDPAEMRAAVEAALADTARRAD